jgi:hypothetical protein
MMEESGHERGFVGIELLICLERNSGRNGVYDKWNGSGPNGRVNAVARFYAVMPVPGIRRECP